MDTLTSIKDVNKQRVGEIFAMYIKEPWYFEKGYEKVILVLLGILGLWKIGGLIF